MRGLLEADRCSIAIVGGQALDLVDIRLLQLLQKLPSISRQRFDIFPLPLGIDGVERQRRFPRSAEPGDDRPTDRAECPR